MKIRKPTSGKPLSWLWGNRNAWFWVILCGYFIRFLIMPIMGQNDVLFMAWQSHFVSLGNWSLYSYLYDRYGEIVLNRLWAPYPYGFYLFTAAWLKLLELIRLVDLGNWVRVWEVAYPARMVFLAKLAYIPFDLWIGYLLFRSLRGITGMIAWALWAWSPVAFYTPIMMGQNDIYATALMVAGVYSAGRALGIDSDSQEQDGLAHHRLRWGYLSVLLLGTGAIFKVFPLLLIPIMAMLISRKWGQRFLLVLVGFSILLFVSMPFLNQPAYQRLVLFNPEGMQIFREVQVLGTSVYPFLVIYLIILLGLGFTRQRCFSAEHAWSSALLVIGLLFLLVPAPLYWYLWIVPLLIAVLIRQPAGLTLITIQQLCVVLLIFNQHRELGVGLPIHLSAEFNIPSVTDLFLQTNLLLYNSTNLFYSLLKSLVTASLIVSLFYAARAFWDQKKTITKIEQCSAILEVMLPLSFVFVILVSSIFLVKNYVSEIFTPAQGSILLSTDQPVISQAFIPKSGTLTGFRLQTARATNPATGLTLCVFDRAIQAQTPLGCSMTTLGKQLEEKYSYFPLEPALQVVPGKVYRAEIALDPAEGSIELPLMKASPRVSLIQNEQASDLRIGLSATRPINFHRAINQLLRVNILFDGILLVIMLSCAAFTWIVIAWALRDQPEARNP